MSRLIDADEAKRNCERICDPYAVMAAKAQIDSTETVDAVAVVRCEKCMYWQSGENECEKWEYCTFHNIGIGPHSFCSYGERKECADNG